MHKLSRSTIVVAAVGGALWILKSLIITALDDSFGTVESVFFIGGLLLVSLTAVLAAWDLVGRRSTLGVLATAGVAVGLFALTSLLLAIGQWGVAAVATGDNLGLEEEGGVFLAGVAWLAVAICAGRVPAFGAPRIGSAAA